MCSPTRTTSRSKSWFAFCGSLAACELTTRGASVVLEAGQRLEPATDLRKSEGNAARITCRCADQPRLHQAQQLGHERRIPSYASGLMRMFL